MKRGSFYSWLEEEAKFWVQDGIVSQEQVQKILARSEVSISERETETRRSKIISYISGLGAILLGVGIILFFASNWEKIPKGVKLLAIYSSLFSSYYFGFTLCYVKRTFPRVGMALLLLGSILFGSAIFLLAQIYNIHAHYPNGLLLWGIGVLPLAYILSSRAILTMAICILTTWLGTEMSFWIEDYIYYYSATYYFTIYGVWSVFLYSFGTVQTKFELTKYYAGVYRYLGMIGISFVSFLFGFREWPIHALDYNMWDITKTVLAILFVASVVNIAIGLGYKRPKSKPFTYEMQGLLLFLLILIASSFISEPGIDYSSGYYYRHKAVLYPIIYNLVLFSACVGIVLLGYANRNITYVNLGTSFIGLQVFARYIEYSWDFLDRSIFFIITGLVLLGIGYVIEKQRRKIIQRMRSA